MASLLSYALTNLSDVKESLGIASSDHTKDNLIIRNINKATRAIEGYCGRHFAQTTYTDEEYGGTQTDQLILRQRPVISLSSISIRDTSLNLDDWESIDGQYYFVDDNSGVVSLTIPVLGRYNRYKVTYTAGYATIPEDLAEACANLAAYWTLNPAGQDIGVAQVKEGQREVRYANGSLSFVSIIQNLGIDVILDNYSNYPLATER